MFLHHLPTTLLLATTDFILCFRPLEHFRSQKMCSNESPGFPSQKSHFPSSSTLRNCLCFSLAHYPALLEETTLLWTYDDSKPIFLNETTVCLDFLPHPKTLLLSPLLSFVSAAHLMLFLLTVGAVSGGYFPSFRWVIAPSKARNGVLSFSSAQGSLLRTVAAHQYQCWLLCDIPEAFFVAVLSYLERLSCQLDAVNVLSPHAAQLIGWHGHRKMGTPCGHCRFRKGGAAEVDGERHGRTASARERGIRKGVGKGL